MIDNHPDHGGGKQHDLLVDSVYCRLLERCSAGAYAAIIASPPCSTFSVSRFFKADVPDGGPPPVRDRDHIMGLPDVPPTHQRELQQANLLVERTASLLRAGRDAGSEYLLEHPADRGHIASPLFLHARHAPIWILPSSISDLQARDSCSRITFPLCALGAQAQKYTTLLCTPGL
eukprot:6200005-Pleurochrysis_carterae.AAC.2